MVLERVEVSLHFTSCRERTAAEMELELILLSGNTQAMQNLHIPQSKKTGSPQRLRQRELSCLESELVISREIRLD